MSFALAAGYGFVSGVLAAGIVQSGPKYLCETYGLSRTTDVVMGTANTTIISLLASAFTSGPYGLGVKAGIAAASVIGQSLQAEPFSKVILKDMAPNLTPHRASLRAKEIITNPTELCNLATTLLEQLAKRATITSIILGILTGKAVASLVDEDFGIGAAYLAAKIL